MKSIVNSNGDAVAYLDSNGNFDVLGRVRVNENNQSVQLPTMNEATKEMFKQMYINCDERPLTDSNRCKFNSNTDYFEMNGLTDLTFEDMMKIYSLGTCFYPYLSTKFSRFDGRTNYSNGMNKNITSPTFQQQIISDSSQIEVLNLGVGVYYTTAHYPFFGLPKLTNVLGTIHMDYLNNVTQNVFKDCKELRYVEINKLNNSITLFSGNTKKITYDCMKYLVDHLATASNKTITTNATLYSYLTGTATPPEASGGTSEEWKQLVTDAQAKGFTFAT